MAEHPASLIVLFIGGLVVTVAVGGAIASQAVLIDDAFHGSTNENAGDVRTDIRILNDPGEASGEYDATNETLTLYVENAGTRTLPDDAANVDLLVDGRYVTNASVSLLDGEDWTTGVVAEVEANVSLSPGTHRAVVIVDGDRETYEFRTGTSPNVLSPNLPSSNGFGSSRTEAFTPRE